MAIQLIINKELGLTKMKIRQGAFIIEELTDLVEEAVLVEFDRITERGGVLEQWKQCIKEEYKKKAFVRTFKTHRRISCHRRKYVFK